ncbi:MAG: FAD-dependent monooxygenase [Phycisphaerales bacterium]|nr:MAG: FAD-dependent monooxygenase [Phycisphaerales bacterium]
MRYGEGKSIIIVGAGLAGALLACALGERGYRVRVFERRPDPRAKGFIGGRSINLALSVRGIDALKRVGLDRVVMKDAIPMRGRVLHDPLGGTAFQAYSKDGKDAINSISRGGLNLTLANEAEKHPNVTLHFAHRCEDVDLDAPSATFSVDDPNGTRLETVHADAIFGTDGAFSAVRTRMQKQDRFDYDQSYLAHGYKELHIPPTSSGEFAMEPNALHIWPRGGSMMIALPNPDKSFTCTLFWPFDGPHSFANLRTRDEVRAFFEREYKDAVPMMPTLVDDFISNPTSSLVTVRCWPWRHAAKVCILGDAAHAIVPFYGQGMNCAFEDVACLIDMLDAEQGDLAKVLPRFEAARKQNADAIADMALENFIEMRDKVASPWFRLKKKAEHALEAILPGVYRSLYTMVSFSTIPYAKARARARKQSSIIRGTVVAIAFAAAITLLALGLSMGR